MKRWLIFENGATVSNWLHEGKEPPEWEGKTFIEVTEAQAADPGRWELVNGELSEIEVAETEPEVTYKDLRRQEYLLRLGDQGDQNDAIYKTWRGAVDLLKEMGATDQQLQKHGLLPDQDAEPGTPAHWLGTIEDIKVKNPKPDKP